MYEELIKQLRNRRMCIQGLGTLNDYPLLGEAADAIEELICEVADEHNARLDAEERQRWIPVTERLPKEWWPVLGLLQFPAPEEPPSQEVLWYLGNGHWRSCWNADMIESPISHWMPLPEPPNGEE